jgi:hypothetical protein
MDLTIKLLKPAVVAGHTTSELTLRELSVAENLALEKSHKDKTPLEQDVHFFALSTGVAPDVILALGQRDWTRLKTRYWETLGNVGLEAEPSE